MWDPKYHEKFCTLDQGNHYVHNKQSKYENKFPVKYHWISLDMISNMIFNTQRRVCKWNG